MTGIGRNLWSRRWIWPETYSDDAQSMVGVVQTLAAVAVTVTMSSIRTPNLPAIDPWFDGKAHARHKWLLLTLDHVWRLVSGDHSMP